MFSFRQSLIVVAAALAASATGCGGSSGGSVTPRPTTTASPPTILVAGSQRTFTGTDTTSHVYANPSPGQANYTSASSFTATTTIQDAASGAPATFDVNSVVDYTVTQAATTGTQTLTSDSDTFENQTMSGSTTTISEPANTSVTTANDVSAAAAGGGPYTLTTNDSTQYVTPFTNGVYPLQTGSSINEPLARTVTENQTDLNSGNGTPPSSYVYTTSLVQTYNGDGSYTIEPRNYSNGVARNVVENSNGTATVSDTNDSFAEVVSLPTLVGATYFIPVSVTNTSGTTTTAYSAADWYPGNANPPSPLETETLTVKGPVGSLPSGCAGALAEPNIVEVDTNVATLNVFGSYETEAQQAYNSNGINDCILRTTTTLDYSLTTGAPTETIVENYAEVLTAVGTASKVRAKQVRRI